ncbi:MAG: DNA polymerase III subunit delta [Candidatus Magasanikbacteria bacterium CG10_big_fil_rev_8_21_14_0_10_36_16]|uniref:DNA polymerase III subunit delta n=1 Tax=Candidatus Magasanikbacteria bacterium CG10_big_fil_rev_8_21_14_0_10_36_16 TaxID=1974645 RepID=A0A2H0TYM8_9BACT|nr:MAG: DNA polymerase III subunit delta [Candidatus Magasanikbacteria bacterium CG10_big_fil_rev_8_21_14_0_10_36_16]
MIIFLYGKDTYRSRQQLKKMVDKFKVDRDPQGFNVVELDCDKETGANIMQQLLTAPFLAEKKMIVLKNLLSASEHKDFLSELMTRIDGKRLPEENIILFWEGNDTFKTKNAKTLFEKLKKEKFVQSFPEMRGLELSNWVKSEIVSRGGKIEPKALNFLLQNFGNDMWSLSTIIDQLLSYTSQEISLEDVQKFLGEKVDDNIFNLIDFIVGKQKNKVFKMIRKQYENGEDAQFIFAMILRQFRILLELREVYEKQDNMHSADLAKILGIHPFVVTKSMAFVKRYTLNQIKDIYLKLLEIDTKTKTGQGGQSFLLDVFVGTL